MKHHYRAPLLYLLVFTAACLVAFVPSGLNEFGKIVLLICTIPWSLLFQLLVLFFIHEGYGPQASVVLSILAGLLNAGILFLMSKRTSGVKQVNA